MALLIPFSIKFVAFIITFFIILVILVILVILFLIFLISFQLLTFSKLSFIPISFIFIKLVSSIIFFVIIISWVRAWVIGTLAFELIIYSH